RTSRPQPRSNLFPYTTLFRSPTKEWGAKQPRSDGEGFLIFRRSYAKLKGIPLVVRSRIAGFRWRGKNTHSSAHDQVGMIRVEQARIIIRMVCHEAGVTHSEKAKSGFTVVKRIIDG